MNNNSKDLITNVIGFKLKGITTEVKEPNGEIKLLKGGIRSTVCACKPEPIKHKETNTKWFTTFNQQLLDKIRDHQLMNFGSIELKKIDYENAI
jgi:hypothetical protein